MKDTKPCIHIRPWLSPLLDKALRGPFGAYIQWHVDRCPRCRTALANLREIVGRLAAARGTPPPPPAMPQERWTAIEAAWEAVEKGSPPDQPRA